MYVGLLISIRLDKPAMLIKCVRVKLFCTYT